MMDFGDLLCLLRVRLLLHSKKECPKGHFEILFKHIGLNNIRSMCLERKTSNKKYVSLDIYTKKTYGEMYS